MLGSLTKLFSNISLKPFTTSTNFMSSTINQGSPFWPKYDHLLVSHLKGKHTKKRPNKNPLVDRPKSAGVVIRTLIRKPRKPNSANRKCVLVKVSNGKELQAYVPGEGHNLQEHSRVLVQYYRLRDVPGVKLRCLRGARDLAHVIKKKQ